MQHARAAAVLCPEPPHSRSAPAYSTRRGTIPPLPRPSPPAALASGDVSAMDEVDPVGLGR